MNLTKIKNRIRFGLHFILAAGVAAGVSVSEAATLNLQDTPLYLLTPVGPNVVLTFDDSGSMSWGYLPDSVESGTNNDGTADQNSLSDNRAGCSSNVNKVYYDPNVTYEPPVKADGTALNATATTFTAAYKNGFKPSDGTVNLSSAYVVDWNSGPLSGIGTYGPASATCGASDSTFSAGKAFYYNYKTSLTGCPGNVYSNACYELVQNGNSSAGGTWGTTDQQNFANWYSYYRTRNMLAKTAMGRALLNLPPTVRMSAQHLNASGASTGSGAAIFDKAPSTLAPFCDNPSPPGNIAGCPVGSTARTDFYAKLYDSPDSGGTPLRKALARVGDYLSTAAPYYDDPSATSGTERACRQNFHILMTDGYWNDSGSTGLITGNKDGADISSFPDGTTYNYRAPYGDSNSSTLADGAFYYWATDLRTGLANNVPPHLAANSGTAAANVKTPTSWAAADYWNYKNDPATWQHMENFTIGLGANGTLDHSSDTAAATTLATIAGTAGNPPASGTAGYWPNPGSGDNPQAIDDLWHAAVNSRGEYYFANDPKTITKALADVMNTIANVSSSAASAALNSGSIGTNTRVYQAKFESVKWIGQVLAYPIDVNTGQVKTGSSDIVWNAGYQLSNVDFAGRTILTMRSDASGRDGISFDTTKWPSSTTCPTPTTATTASELDCALVTALRGTDTDTIGQRRLNYIRGQSDYEIKNTGGTFRTRYRICAKDGTLCKPTDAVNKAVLGDIIDSTPVYVAAPPYNYTDTGYSAFVTANASRTAMIYVGANDGMLHGFDASNGTEKIAYVPSPVFRNLAKLAEPTYSHKFFADGSPVVGDVYISSAWKTILVGGLRQGGQGIYALDITDPSAFGAGDTAAASTVLWEFTDKDDADLGYTYSQPVIAKVRTDSKGGTRWAVIFGNGYNNNESDSSSSASGNAVLYILFIDGGVDGTWTVSTDYIKIDTGEGITATIATPNGLSSPAVADVDGDGVADYVYAGDLRGNMWKFDITGGTPANWSNSANFGVVYTAKDASGNTQPITSRPQVGRMPAGQPGYMVYFGTGKYLEASDASLSASSQVQTFYGIWDGNPVTKPSRSDLLKQTVIAVDPTKTYRVVSNNSITWKTTTGGTGSIGWYLDLPTADISPGSGGERVVSDPILRGDRVIFTTVIPSDDPCTAGGSGWLMELSSINGGQLDSTPFDVNGDGTFSNADLISVTSGGTTSSLPAGGQKFSGGIPASPAILVGGNPNVGGGGACGGQECKYVTNTDGSINRVIEQTGFCNYCRGSWRQIR